MLLVFLCDFIIICVKIQICEVSKNVVYWVKSVCRPKKLNTTLPRLNNLSVRKAVQKKKLVSFFRFPKDEKLHITPCIWIVSSPLKLRYSPKPVETGNSRLCGEANIRMNFIPFHVYTGEREKWDNPSQSLLKRETNWTSKLKIKLISTWFWETLKTDQNYFSFFARKRNITWT